MYKNNQKIGIVNVNFYIVCWDGIDISKNSVHT